MRERAHEVAERLEGAGELVSGGGHHHELDTELFYKTQFNRMAALQPEHIEEMGKRKHISEVQAFLQEQSRAYGHSVYGDIKSRAKLASICIDPGIAPDILGKKVMASQKQNAQIELRNIIPEIRARHSMSEIFSRENQLPGADKPQLGNKEDPPQDIVLKALAGLEVASINVEYY